MQVKRRNTGAGVGENDSKSRVVPGARGPNRMGAVNLRDVAAHAKVSLATASRVFAENSKVQPETKSRVLASAEELGYVVNGLARAMTGRGPRSIAFIARAMIGPTFATLAAGVESVASKNGHLMLMSATEGDLRREKALIAIQRELRVKAVLLVGSTETHASFDQRAADYARDLAQVNASLIVCGRPPVASHDEIVSVDYDQRVGIGMAVDELVGLGHRRIAYIGAARGMTTAELRLDGYQQALERSGIAFDASLVGLADNTEADGARATGEMLRSRAAATAIVAMTDNIAVGAYRAAREQGLRIPEDVSIVGFDDVPFVGDLTPGLSTVHPPFFELGVRAAR
jgi:LacI family transcriptional regulator